MPDKDGIVFDGIEVSYEGAKSGTIAISKTQAQSITFDMHAGQNVTLKGLPKGAVVTFTETDPLNYTPSTAVASMDAATTGDNGDTGTGTVSGTGGTITITNTLAEISPTGVILRIAPYVAILGGGIALLLLSKRTKKDDEDEKGVPVFN